MTRPLALLATGFALAATPAHAFGQRTPASPAGHEAITVIGAKRLAGGPFAQEVAPSPDIAQRCRGPNCFGTDSSRVFSAVMGVRWADFMGFTANFKSRITPFAGLDQKCVDAVAQNNEEVQYDHFLRRLCDEGTAGRNHAIAASKARLRKYFLDAVKGSDDDVEVTDGGAPPQIKRRVIAAYFLLGRALHLLQDSFSPQHAIRIFRPQQGLNFPPPVIDNIKSFVCTRDSPQHEHTHPSSFLEDGDNPWIKNVEGSVLEDMKPAGAQWAVLASTELFRIFFKVRTQGAAPAREIDTFLDAWMDFDPAVPPRMRFNSDVSACKKKMTLTTRQTNNHRLQCLDPIGSGAFASLKVSDVDEADGHVALNPLKPPLSFSDLKIDRSLISDGPPGTDVCDSGKLADLVSPTSCSIPASPTLSFTSSGHAGPIRVPGGGASTAARRGSCQCPPGSRPHGNMCAIAHCAAGMTRKAGTCKFDCRLHPHAPGCKTVPQTGCQRITRRALKSSCNVDPESGFTHFWTENPANDHGEYTIVCDNGYKDVTPGKPGNHGEAGWFYHGFDNVPLARSVKQCRSKFVGFAVATHKPTCVEGVGPMVPCVRPGTTVTKRQRIVSACAGEIGHEHLEDYYRKSYGEHYDEAWTARLRVGKAPNLWGGPFAVWCAITGGTTQVRWATAKAVQHLGHFRSDFAAMRPGDIVFTKANVYGVVESLHGATVTLIKGQPVRRENLALGQLGGFYSVGD